MERLRWARWFGWVATTIVIAVLLGAGIFKDEALKLVKEHEQHFKLVGLGLGPFLAVIGFIWGAVDKIELKHLAGQLGTAKAEAEEKAREAKEQERQAKEARAEFDRKEARITALQRDLTMIADSRRIWKLRANAPFPQYRDWKDGGGARIVTVGLFKGGVGKTQLAANFAAYVSEKQQKPVLLIDLDFQGSLSTLLLTATAIDPTGSRVDSLLAENADLASLSENRIQLAGNGPATVLNGGRGLSRAWLVPADYTLAEVESQLLVDRVLNDDPILDERYRLSHLLLHPSIRREYAMIIIDTPPRMTLGTVNALVASHSYIIPTVLDRVSSEAVRPFIEQVEALKRDLNVSVDLAGLVATMTRTVNIDAREGAVRGRIEDTVRELLGENAKGFIGQSLPRTVDIANGSDLGYFLGVGGNLLRDRFYDAIFDELWTRIIRPQESA